MPVGFLVWFFAILMAAAAFPIVFRVWKEKRSRSWPRAEASVENFEISRRGRSYVLECAFSYSVDGRPYRGTYWRGGFKSELERLAESLKKGPLFARYNPVRPGEFFMDPFRDLAETS